MFECEKSHANSAAISLRGLRRCSFRGWGGRLKERFVRGFVRYL